MDVKLVGTNTSVISERKLVNLVICELSTENNIVSKINYEVRAEYRGECKQRLSISRKSEAASQEVSVEIPHGLKNKLTFGF